MIARISLRPLIGIAVLLATAFFANRLTNVDLAVASWFYSPSEGGFALRNSWLWGTVLHDGGKLLSVVVWLALLLLLVVVSTADAGWRRGATCPLQLFLVFTLLVSIVSAVVTAWIKSRSLHSCPWTLQMFGGNFQFFRIFEPIPAAAGAGRCLPSGHASVGFMWIAAIFASRRWLPRYVRAIVIAVISLGCLASVVQIARGEHFLSHALLTAALCWAIAWAADSLFELKRKHDAALSIGKFHGR